jgi:hypothetical protein
MFEDFLKGYKVFRGGEVSKVSKVFKVFKVFKNTW